MNEHSLHLISALTLLVVSTTLGDIFLANAMRHIGDVGELRARKGLVAVIGAVLSSGRFYLAVSFMACSFFSLLVALSWGDVSLVLPASTSLTFLTNTVTAKFFLKERVDHRRWAAAFCVAAGMALLST